MILKPNETTVAYRCPDCGCGVKSIVGIFSLSADLLKLKCPCGSSSMTIKRTNDDKIRISVPCMVCRRDHEFVISKELFFKNELFELPCSLSGFSLCFIGNGDDVSSAIDRADEELYKVLKEAGAENLDIFKAQQEKTEEIPVAQIYDIVRFILKELEEEHAIRCNCSEGEYDIELFDDAVCVYCKNCGAKQLISTASISEAQAFLEIDELILK
ncbi:MAG: hypothetical protein E7598_01840 [Ruminococcaceae bacterium]|nr:hypothetical protein [Oscillospiraceae bacterium]